MAKKRYINTQFWRDSYIANLDPSEKLVFLYLITNPDTNISGIYQTPLKIIATDTGFDKDMIIKILARFEKDNKVKYENGWVALKNFQKNQNEKSPAVFIGIENEMKNAPETLQKWVNSRLNEELDCHPTVSHLNLNSNLDLDYNLDSIKQEKEESFNIFWNIYDKKVNPKVCKALWSKIDQSLYQCIYDHSREYVKSKPDKQYRKDPERYLKNEMWTSEIITDCKSKPEIPDNLKRFEEMEKTL